MLAKSNRLSGRLVARVHAKGRLTRQQNLIIKSLPNNVGHPRVSLVVPKKVDNRATKRNRLRRQVSALLEQDVRNSSVGIDLLITIYADQPIEKFSQEIKKWFAF